MSSLYQLTVEHQHMMDMLTDTEIPIDAVLDTLEVLKLGIRDKADSCAKFRQSLMADSEAIKTEIKRLTARAKAFDIRADALKDALYNTMKTTGDTSFKTSLFTFRIQSNPKKVTILDESKIPPEYTRTVTMTDKDAIGIALKNGLKVPGCELTQTESLRIL